MSVESVLSEILGVPCGDVKFIRESSSNWLGYKPTGEPLEEGYYVHGTIRHYLEFTTKEPLMNFRVGSIAVTSGDDSGGYFAILLYGKETSRIVRAIADELV